MLPSIYSGVIGCYIKYIFANSHIRFVCVCVVTWLHNSCAFIYLFYCAKSTSESKAMMPRTTAMTAAVCFSVRWRLLPHPQAPPGRGGLRGAGVGQLRSRSPGSGPRLGVGHRRRLHSAGPVGPVEGGQPHRLDRGAHLLRGVFHGSPAVWGEAQPGPLQWVNSFFDRIVQPG